MSDISPIVPGNPGPTGGYGTAGPISRNGAAGGPASVPSHSAADSDRFDSSISSFAGEDRVEVSNFARYLDQIRRLPEVRLDRIAAARRAIAEGLYESEEVLDRTIERMTEEEAL